MADFEAQLVVGLTALSGTAVYPIQLPQTVTLPAVTYFLVDTVRNQTHQGDDKLPTRRVQVNVTSLSYGTTKDVANLIIDGIKDGTPTLGTLYISHARISNERDDFDPLTSRYTRSIDLLLSYEDS
jgi:hypothetical protein